MPATSAATFSFRVLPGIYDLALVCTDTCDTTDPYVYLATGIHFQ